MSTSKAFTEQSSHAVCGVESAETELCNIVVSSTKRLSAGFYHFEELFNVDESVTLERSIIDVGKSSRIMLCVIALPEPSITSSWTAVEAARYLRQHLSLEDSHCTTFMYSSPSHVSDDTITYMATALSLASHEAASIVLSSAERDALHSHEYVARFYEGGLMAKLHSKRSSHLSVLAILVMATLALLIIALSRARLMLSGPANVPYQRYDITGSHGPRYQLQFSYSNVSDWARSHPHTNDEWFLRIDDQAMIPTALVDEEELRYQAWYQTRYPEMNAIRLNQTYLDEEFLGDPEAIQIPADTTFHMSHCVRAVRRYWQARETGRHVCPRDIDHRHVKHCLDALDMWAFPEGPRGSIGGMELHSQRAEDTTRLVWKTKVCFDE